MSQRADRRPVPLIPEGGPLWFPPEDGWRVSGLLAAGGDLSPERLVYAYGRGIFPWYDEDTPILWWSPDPRCVLFPDELHVPRSLAKTLRRGAFSFSFDRAFAAVIRNSAAASRPGQLGTSLATLVGRLRERGFVLLDCQQTTPHVVRLGAREIPRREFLALVRRYTIPASINLRNSAR